jgi:hypothetical protein
VNARSRARWTFSSCRSFFLSLSTCNSKLRTLNFLEYTELRLTLATEIGYRTSCCSAIFLSLRDWLLFLMPGVVGLEDGFITAGALELGLLWPFSIT